jgi:ribosomal protein L40E
MIITQQKPLEEIKKNLEGFNKLIIVGCSDCASICQTGGSEQVKEMTEKLKGDGKEVLATLMCQNPCDARVVKRDVKFIEDELGQADAILSMACGLGAQDLAKITGKVVIPANNTRFMGQIEKLGQYYSLCCGCDNCVLFENEGKCPVVIRKVCNECGRVLAWDAKCCDQCKSEDLKTGEILKIEA